MKSIHSPFITSVTFGLAVIVFGACSEREVKFAPQKNNSNQPSSTVSGNAEINVDDIVSAASDSFDSGGLSSYNLTSLNPRIKSRSVKTITPNFTELFTKQDLSREVNYLNGVVINYRDFQYQAGKIQKRVLFDGAGPDGQWQTKDDLIASYVDYAPANTLAKHVHFSAAGVDGAWFTDDDVIASYETDMTDSGGTVIGEVNYNASGPDGQWFTNDDVILDVQTRGKNAAGDGTWVRYSAPGPDGDWTTLDDNIVAEFVVRSMKAPGQPNKIVMFVDVGPDGQLFTSDDVPRSYRTFTYDAQNEVTQSIFYAGGPGPDGNWFTADDVIRLCRQLERDAAGKPYRTVGYRPGPDASCFTSDDVIRGYHQDDFNAANLVTKSTTYMGNGADAKWFTTDDDIVEEEYFVVP